MNHSTTHDIMPLLLLAAASSNRVSLWSWDGEHAQIRDIYRQHSKQVNALACSPDGTMIASAGEDGTLSLWDVHGGYTRWMHEFRSPIAALAWSGGTEKLLAVAIGCDVFLVRQDGASRHRMSQSALVTDLAWSPDGKYLATGGKDGLWRWSSHSTHLEKGEIASLAWSLRGLLAAGERRTMPRAMAHMQVFDGNTLQHRYVAAHANAVDALAWSPDGSRIASAGGGHVRLWNHQKRRCLLVIRCPEVSSLAWSPDGIWLAISSPQGVQIYETGTGDLWMTLPPDRQDDLDGPVIWVSSPIDSYK